MAMRRWRLCVIFHFIVTNILWPRVGKRDTRNSREPNSVSVLYKKERETTGIRRSTSQATEEREELNDKDTISDTVRKIRYMKITTQIFVFVTNKRSGYEFGCEKALLRRGLLVQGPQGVSFERRLCYSPRIFSVGNNGALWSWQKYFTFSIYIIFDFFF